MNAISLFQVLRSQRKSSNRVENCSDIPGITYMFKFINF